jgi:hypothetical protein
MPMKMKASESEKHVKVSFCDGSIHTDKRVLQHQGRPDVWEPSCHIIIGWAAGMLRNISGCFSVLLLSIKTK